LDEGRQRLLDALREHLSFVSKKGSDYGQCGACWRMAGARREAKNATCGRLYWVK
jgi:aerobic-type carbon monoxide dehydrogenase small subunit (CoxS/CutS family)